MGRHQLLTTVAVEEQMEAIALLSEAGTDLNGILCGGAGWPPDFRGTIAARRSSVRE